MESQLRDIKPLLEIPDSSYYFFLLFVVVGLLIAIALLIFLWRFISSRRENLKKRYLKELKSLDWSKTKESAYLATKLGRILAKDRRSKEIYAQLVPMLEPYKYRKEVPMIDSQTLKQYNLLVHILDESI